MFEHCTKHRPAAEVIYMAGNRCPICAELTRLRERIVELTNFNRSIDRAARGVVNDLDNLNRSLDRATREMVNEKVLSEGTSSGNGPMLQVDPDSPSEPSVIMAYLAEKGRL